MTDTQNPRERLVLAIMDWIDSAVCTCDSPFYRPYIERQVDGFLNEIIADYIAQHPEQVYIEAKGRLRAQEGGFG